MALPEDREAASEELARRMNQLAGNMPANTWRFHFGHLAGDVRQEWPVFSSYDVEPWYRRWMRERPESLDR